MQWFESWFDSPYYHILYSHRDEQEAKTFIDTLYDFLKISDISTILDLGCGKGRHALHIASKGNQVFGLDLSPNSIEYAQQLSGSLQLKNYARFEVGDMRNFNIQAKFDFVFNLFTSFGYFDNKLDNLSVIKSISNHQDVGGTLVIDYLNSEIVRKLGEENYVKEIQNIKFQIYKYFENDFVIKEIEINDNESIYKFKEQVQLFSSNEIQDMLSCSGYSLNYHFGNYHLDPYNTSSPRSIFVSTKLTGKQPI